MTRWRRWLAYAGFGAAALAVGTDRRFLAWAAIMLLGLALGMRVVELARARRAASVRDTLSE
jgi:uncharacterized membrane protein